MAGVDDDGVGLDGDDLVGQVQQRVRVDGRHRRVDDLHLAVGVRGPQPVGQDAREGGAPVEGEAGGRRLAQGDDPKRVGRLLADEVVGVRVGDVALVHEVAARHLPVLHHHAGEAVHRHEERVVGPVARQAKAGLEHDEERDGQQDHPRRERESATSR